MATTVGNNYVVTCKSGDFTMWVRIEEEYDTSTNKWRPVVRRIGMSSASPYGYYGWTYYLHGTVTVGGITALSANSGNGTHPVTIGAQNSTVQVGNMPGNGAWTSRSICTAGTAAISVNLAIYTTSGGGGSGSTFTGTGTLNLTGIGHKSVNGGTAGVHTKCSICGTTLSTTHSYSSSISVPPTCTVKGTTKYTCSCGYSYSSQNINALGHNHVGTVVSPTCTDQGYTKYKCSRCGDTSKANDTYVAALGHNSVNGGTAAIHTKCSRCGTTLSSAHSYTKTTQTPASCTEKGTSKYTCGCGYSYTSQDIAALGHQYDSTITKQPTYTSTGVLTHTCQNCTDTYTEVIPKKNGAVRICVNNEYKPYLAHVYTGGTWVLHVPFVFDENEWKPSD